MRKTGAILAMAAVLTTSAFAAQAPATSPLPAGKPAGVHQAALEMGGVLVVIGLAAVAGAIAAIASNTQGTSTGTGA